MPPSTHPAREHPSTHSAHPHQALSVHIAAPLQLDPLAPHLVVGSPPTTLADRMKDGGCDQCQVTQHRPLFLLALYPCQKLFALYAWLVQASTYCQTQIKLRQRHCARGVRGACAVCMHACICVFKVWGGGVKRLISTTVRTYM